MKKIILIFLFLIAFQAFPAHNRLKINLDKESIENNRKILKISTKEALLKTLKSNYNRLYNSYKCSIINGATPVFTDLRWTTLNNDTVVVIEYSISGISHIKKTYIINNIIIDDSNQEKISSSVNVLIKISVYSKKLNKNFKTVTMKDYKFKYSNGKFHFQNSHITLPIN